MCRFFRISRAADYAWGHKLDQNDVDQERMHWVDEAHWASHRRYGYRRIKLWLLRERGVNLNHKAILRLMRKLGIRSIARRPQPYRRLGEEKTSNVIPMCLTEILPPHARTRNG